MAEGEPKLNDASGQIGLHDEADQKRAEPPVGETAEADRAADSSRQSGLSADEQESRQQPAAKEAEGGERADSPPAELPAKPVRPTGMEPPRTRIRLSDEEEQEIEAALAELDELAATPAGPASGQAAVADVVRPLEPGQRRSGKVIAIHGDDIFVQLESKSEGVLPIDQFEDQERPVVGQTVNVVIDRYDPLGGLWMLRLPRAAQEADWSSLQEGMIVEGRVTEANKGGLVLNINGIRAFMPASQVDLTRVENLSKFVGQTLKCQVTELRRPSRNLVVSRRALLEAEREEQRRRTWEQLEEGQVRSGTVRNIQPFGVFVDVGGVDGLIPMSELSWVRVEDAHEVVSLGQEVQVKVLKVDRDSQRLTLGLKQLTASPWQTFQQRYPMGATVTGRVTRIAQFGAFVEIEPGVEGLVHISQLARHRVRRVRDVLQEGQEVRVRLIDIDPEARRLSLSIRAVLEEEERQQWEEAKRRAAQQAEQRSEPQEGQQRPEPKRKPKRPLRGGLGDDIAEDGPFKLF